MLAAETYIRSMVAVVWRGTLQPHKLAPLSFCVSLCRLSAFQLFRNNGMAGHWWSASLKPGSGVLPGRANHHSAWFSYCRNSIFKRCRVAFNFFWGVCSSSWQEIVEMMDCYLNAVTWRPRSRPGQQLDSSWGDDKNAKAPVSPGPSSVDPRWGHLRSNGESSDCGLKTCLIPFAPQLWQTFLEVTITN